MSWKVEHLQSHSTYSTFKTSICASACIADLLNCDYIQITQPSNGYSYLNHLYSINVISNLNRLKEGAQKSPVH